MNLASFLHVEKYDYIKLLATSASTLKSWAIGTVVARLLCKQEAPGSKPGLSIIENFFLFAFSTVIAISHLSTIWAGSSRYGRGAFATYGGTA